MQWAVWNSRSPIGDERCFDLGHALQRKTLVDMHTKRGGRHNELTDYLPFHYRNPELSDTERAIIAYFKSIGAAEA